MDLKWTPGPWRVGKPYSDVFGLDCRVAETHVRDSKFRWVESVERVANAHLIAAAPDLYEAGDAAFVAMETACAHLLHSGNREAMSALRRVADDLQDALARARGENA